jgi:murein DD-endopeptidase MepM/ murein hydrolase activator NlpD
MQRKTLSERLTNKYQLIVRNEENFADRWSFSFNFARLLVLFTVLTLLFYAVVTGINFLGAYLLGSDSSEDTQQLVMLAAKVDSMEYEMQLKDEYLNSVKIMLNGGVTKSADTAQGKSEKYAVDEKMSKEEEEFRAKYEKEFADPQYKPKEGFTALYFTSPVPGKATDLEQGGKTIGIYIQADKNKPVRAVEAGIVAICKQNADSSFTLIIQHKNGLLTMYDGIKKPLVTSTANVDKGSDIAQAAEQKILFKMIFNGKVLNPREYVAWGK